MKCYGLASSHFLEIMLQLFVFTCGNLSISFSCCCYVCLGILFCLVMGFFLKDTIQGQKNSSCFVFLSWKQPHYVPILCTWGLFALFHVFFWFYIRMVLILGPGPVFLLFATSLFIYTTLYSFKKEPWAHSTGPETFI